MEDRSIAGDESRLVIFPKVELRKNAARDTLIQNTFIDLTNDYPEDMQVPMYFINGDGPITP